MTQPQNDFPKLGQPALRALAGAGITHLEQLTGYGESEIRQLHGIGPNALKMLREALSQRSDLQRRESKMRRLKLQVQMTVDGYITGPNGEMDFTARNWDDKLIQYVTELTEPIDCIILGRKLAQGFIPHWAGVAADPGHPEYTAGQKFTETHKVVFTKTLARSEWANTVLAKGNLVDEITSLKRQAGRDIIAYGGATFVSALVKHDLIDEFHLFINPAAIGSGLSIFKELEGKQKLTLVKATPFDCGIVVLNYAPQRD